MNARRGRLIGLALLASGFLACQRGAHPPPEVRSVFDAITVVESCRRAVPPGPGGSCRRQAGAVEWHVQLDSTGAFRSLMRVEAVPLRSLDSAAQAALARFRAALGQDSLEGTTFHRWPRGEFSVFLIPRRVDYDPPGPQDSTAWVVSGIGRP